MFCLSFHKLLIKQQLAGVHLLFEAGNGKHNIQFKTNIISDIILIYKLMN